MKSKHLAGSRTTEDADVEKTQVVQIRARLDDSKELPKTKRKKEAIQRLRRKDFRSAASGCALIVVQHIGKFVIGRMWLPRQGRLSGSADL